MSELKIITGGKQPAILTVMADEEVTGSGEPPAMSTLADLVLILDNVVNSPPYFHNAKYLYINTTFVILMPHDILLFGNGQVCLKYNWI